MRVEVQFNDYANCGAVRVARVERASLLECLKVITDNTTLYIDSESIEEEGWTAEQVLTEIDGSNGDGCDYIEYIKDLDKDEYIFAAMLNPEIEEW